MTTDTIDFAGQRARLTNERAEAEQTRKRASLDNLAGNDDGALKAARDRLAAIDEQLSDLGAAESQWQANERAREQCEFEERRAEDAERIRQLQAEIEKTAAMVDATLHDLVGQVAAIRERRAQIDSLATYYVDSASGSGGDWSRRLNERWALSDRLSPGPDGSVIVSLLHHAGITLSTQILREPGSFAASCANRLDEAISKASQVIPELHQGRG